MPAHAAPRRSRRWSVASIALVAGLGVTPVSPVADGATPISGARIPMTAAAVVTATFTAVGEHAYTVPAGVTSLQVVAIGGRGGDTPKSGTAFRAAAGGGGAVVRSVVPVTPGQTLYAEVGSDADGPTPGANGGGVVASAPDCVSQAGAGGGASDVRTVAAADAGSAASRVVVAGGGGGAGSSAGAIGGDGGNRGEGGRPGVVGRGINSPSAPGGTAGYDGTPGSGTGVSAGAVAAGGTGAAGPASSDGCGGGGGGGYGGGAGGTATSGGIGGGGGGGGGSLDPDGGALGDPSTAPPSVTFEQAPNVESGTLHLTPTTVFSLGTDYTDCAGTCRYCGFTLGVSGCAAPAAAQNSIFDAGRTSQEVWSRNSLNQRYRPQPGVGDIDGPADQAAELGRPFPLLDFVHWNDPSAGGGAPSAIAMEGQVVVQPPAGDPVTLPVGSADGQTLWVNFLETDNTATVAGCDPKYQVSSVPCDDYFSLNQQYTSSVTTVRGVTWHLTVLGWADLNGGYSTGLSTTEGLATERTMYAEITVDTTATTTTVSADATSLTAHVTPAPSTGGTVDFSADGSPIATCQDVAVDTSTGDATCPTPTLTVGDHPIVAAYSGGVGFSASISEPVTLTVSPPPATTLTLTPATSTIALGDSQTYTATAYAEDGTSLGDVTGATSFTISAGGSCDGDVCMAALPGRYVVTGTHGTTTEPPITTAAASAAATDALTGTAVLVVAPRPQTITFPSPGDLTLGGADATLRATASSGLPVTYSVSTPDTCSVTDGLLHPIALGVCTVVASQDGDTTCAAATPVGVTVAVTSPATSSPPSSTAPGSSTAPPSSTAPGSSTGSSSSTGPLPTGDTSLSAGSGTAGTGAPVRQAVLLAAVLLLVGCALAAAGRGRRRRGRRAA